MLDVVCIYGLSSNSNDLNQSHSLFNDFTGLASAALTVCRLTVNNVTTIAIGAASGKTYAVLRFDRRTLAAIG